MNDRSPRQETVAEHDARLRATLPTQVKEQPDPFLQMSTGRLHAGGLALIAAAVVLILGVVFYGLNGSTSDRGTATQTAASTPASPPANSGSGPAPAPPTAQQKGPGGNP